MPPPSLNLIRHLAPPLSSPTRDPHNGTWFPYANGSDFDANMAMVIIILVCALVFALAVNGVIRIFLRHSRRSTQLSSETDTPKLTHAAPARVTSPPTLVFAAGMKLPGAEAECAICLSEFVNGEGVKVLPKCKHGFHVKCIEGWLSSHATCPTCRSSCLTTSPENNAGHHGNEVDVESQSSLDLRE